MHNDKWLLSHPYRRSFMNQSVMQIRRHMVKVAINKKLYELGKKNRKMYRKIQWVLNNQTLIWCKLTCLKWYYKTIGKHVFFSNFGSKGWKTSLDEWAKHPGKLMKFK